jgi:hypothetical protein
MTDPETEEVKPRELREGDWVKHAESWPWVRILKVHEFDENTPDWERAAGTRGFICENLDEDGRRRLLMPEHVIRRRRLAARSPPGNSGQHEPVGRQPRVPIGNGLCGQANFVVFDSARFDLEVMRPMLVAQSDGNLMLAPRPVTLPSRPAGNLDRFKSRCLKPFATSPHARACDAAELDCGFIKVFNSRLDRLCLARRVLDVVLQVAGVHTELVDERPSQLRGVSVTHF